MYPFGLIDKLIPSRVESTRHLAVAQSAPVIRHPPIKTAFACQSKRSRHSPLIFVSNRTLPCTRAAKSTKSRCLCTTRRRVSASHLHLSLPRAATLSTLHGVPHKPSSNARRYVPASLCTTCRLATHIFARCLSGWCPVAPGTPALIPVPDIHPPQSHNQETGRSHRRSVILCDRVCTSQKMCIERGPRTGRTAAEVRARPLTESYGR